MTTTQNTKVYIQTLTGKVHARENCSVAARSTRSLPIPFDGGEFVDSMLESGKYHWCKRCGQQ